MKKFICSTVLGLAALIALSAPSQAAVIRFIVPLDFSQEVINSAGQPGGTGTATLFIDDVTNSVSGSATFSGVTQPLSGFHIHSGIAGAIGGVVVNLQPILSGGTVTDADLANVLANPAGHYVNAHNVDAPNGAVRGQMNAAQAVVVPEAGTLPLAASALAVLGSVGVVARRRKAA